MKGPGVRATAALALAFLLAVVPRPGAAVDWLVLVVDRSNSIDNRELLLQREAYIRLLSDESVIQALGGAKVAIVEFDTRADVMAEWSDAATAARLYRRRPPDGPRGQTAIGSALATALALLLGKRGHLIIDISGDGKENVDQALLSEARAAAVKRSIEINGLAIVTEETPDIDDYYRQRVANGFVLPVKKSEDFYRALRHKLFLEIAGAGRGRQAGNPDSPVSPSTSLARAD